jgi:iron-sulfur cluster assembly accessory protein
MMTASAEQQAAVKLTEAAAGHIREMLASQPENAGKILRVYVEGGGCSGMQYGMVFDEKRDNDELAESFGVPVLVDSISASHLRGALIDYSDALTGGGFKITNPNAKGSCGCGKSFEA